MIGWFRRWRGVRAMRRFGKQMDRDVKRHEERLRDLASRHASRERS